MRSRVDKAWEFFGRSDPYFAVLTESNYRLANLTEDARRRFFASGSAHMDEVIDTIRTHLDNSFEPRRGLDFGCGVGRLTIPMASICRSVIAADVSVSMLEEARENCRLNGITNVDFVRSDDGLSSVSGSFDLINSYLVFQHIPRKRGLAIFTRLLGLLGEGGVGVFHITYYRDSSKFLRLIYWARKSMPLVNGLINLMLRRPLNQPMLEMNEYRLNEVFRALQDSRCDLSHINFSIHTGPYEKILGIMIFCQKRESNVWATGAD